MAVKVYCFDARRLATVVALAVDGEALNPLFGPARRNVQVQRIAVAVHAGAVDGLDHFDRELTVPHEFPNMRIRNVANSGLATGFPLGAGACRADPGPGRGCQEWWPPWCAAKQRGRCYVEVSSYLRARPSVLPAEGTGRSQLAGVPAGNNVTGLIASVSGQLGSLKVPA